MRIRTWSSRSKTSADQEMKMVINWVSQVKVDPKDLAPSVDYQNPDYD